ncbi:MAG TPA: hypothetical protein VFJ58_21375 [Armatimonadota bacterium]|nr:hypothetical protein [Armatimonadota bacterium]
MQLLYAITSISFLLASFACSAVAAPAPGTRGEYAVLSAKTGAPPPFQSVEILYGPRERVGGHDDFWWQLVARNDPAGPTLFTLRALTNGDPMKISPARLTFDRYVLHLPDTRESLEYRNIHTGRALLPEWRDFSRWFVPHRAEGALTKSGLPRTATYLGQTLSLRQISMGGPWNPWSSVRTLNLDPELLIGTGRNFKDAEGHRLPPDQDYTYVPFTAGDYRTMIDDGVNLFTVAPDQEQWVRAEPVFYLRAASGGPPLRYPADLYRSNYLGPVMFLDEPASILIADHFVNHEIRRPSDFVEVLQQRIRNEYLNGRGAFELERELAAAGVNFGTMRLEQRDFPAWETLYETAYYQMRAGLAGFVHEGRYQLQPFNAAMARWTGSNRPYTPTQMFRYFYAFLRGAARAQGGAWGTSIYGQSDPALSPLALDLAYDMGARYLWFWTSDHAHHVPWNEQMALVRGLRKHIADHPRRSTELTPPKLDEAIALPYGTLISLDLLGPSLSPITNQPTGVPEPASPDVITRFNRLMREAMPIIDRALRQGRDFDVTFDEGNPIHGYRHVLRIPRPGPATTIPGS